jgi:hypothetical protein
MNAAIKISDADAPTQGALIVAEWDRNSREVVRVALDQFKGHHTIGARIWYRSGDGLKPGKGGLTLGVKHLPALADAVAKALVQARGLGLLEDTPDNGISRDGGGVR